MKSLSIFHAIVRWSTRLWDSHCFVSTSWRLKTNGLAICNSACGVHVFGGPQCSRAHLDSGCWRSLNLRHGELRGLLLSHTVHTLGEIRNFYYRWRHVKIRVLSDRFSCLRVSKPWSIWALRDISIQFNRSGQLIDNIRIISRLCNSKQLLRPASIPGQTADFGDNEWLFLLTQTSASNLNYIWSLVSRLVLEICSMHWSDRWLEYAGSLLRQGLWNDRWLVARSNHTDYCLIVSRIIDFTIGSASIFR